MALSPLAWRVMITVVVVALSLTFAPNLCLVSTSAHDACGAEKKRREPGSSSTSSSSSRFGCKYDVYLNFRGTDIPKVFVDHLHRALADAGILVCKDVDELRPGADILPEVEEAIKQSRISIAILSTDYASSKRCLDELVQMWECRESNEQTIIPIFYDISPSDVRNQAGDFGEAFSLRKTRGADSENIETWRQVLRQIGGLRGHSANLYKGYEAQLAEEVALSVARKLRDDGLAVTDKLVGIDHHVEEMMRKLDVASSEGQATEVRGADVRVVGICGEPGVGKTTLAKVVFKEMHKLFEASSFLECIASKEVRFSQQMLIADLQKLEHVPLESSDEGTEKIASLFGNRKVLIVLDDLDEDEQINALAKKLTWFGPGSRIIVTTNTREVLSAFDVGADDHGRVEEHEVEPMSDEHALQLFCEHAFQAPAIPDVPEYYGLSREIVEAIRGIPSDIVRHASNLRYNMDIDIWKSTLESLRKHPKDGQALPPQGGAPHPPAVYAPSPAGEKVRELVSFLCIP
ncbi:TMV resistance protein N-like [Rhodamnia argentea]|uniref:TMV resistance protein N-like n=1 Tax=Rhodamnia argentea TaxID=178133 RepID=A0ABM3H4Q5_9MYRT|nr:TMV resistance protein N-like [Rhodamnia argentea]